MAFLARQALTAGLVANSVRPLRRHGGLVPGFLGGWLVTELAPQLLAVTVADAAAELGVRRRRSPGGRPSPASLAGLALAAASSAVLGRHVVGAVRSGGRVETTLRDGLGQDYLDALEGPPTPRDLRVAAREVLHPFRLDDPEVEVVRDVHYRVGGSRARLDVYRPRGVALHDAPVLFQVHGGAWTMGSKEHQGRLLMNRMARRGWVCVAVNYRLAPKHPWPAQIEDVKRSLAWVHEHIGAYGGDAAYVVTTGGSAGGHLAALAALTPGDPQWQPGFEDADTSVAACVPFYGVYDLAGITAERHAEVLRDAFLAPRVFRREATEHHADFVQASPLAHVAPGAPDFFVLHGAGDSVVDVRQARAFVARLRDVGASVTYAELPGAQHAFEVLSSIRSQHAVRAAERWLLHHRARWVAARASEETSRGA